MAYDSIECENFVINIPRDQPPPEWPECCIYSVPKHLRKVNAEAYTPKLISIGPFHHGKDDLKDMEKHKQRYLKHFFLKPTQKSTEEDFRKIIEVNEVKIRHSYSEDRGLESGDFVKMILLDAVFIIELFFKVRDKVKKEEEEESKRKRNKGEEEDEEEDKRKGKEKEESEDEEEAQSDRKNVEEDYILRKPWLDYGICNDLILLENQLPFFVLEKLYKAAFCDSSILSEHQEGQEIQEHKGDLTFLRLFQIYYFRRTEEQTSNINRKVKHFTDLVRYSFYSTEPKSTGSLNHLCSATELDEAGLKFKAIKEDRSLLDITFPESKCLKYCPCFNLSWLLSCLPCLKCFPCLEGMERFLEVPCFEVEDSTECLLRNLMALEQCHYPLNAYVCNYVSLLDDLINDEKDVALLVDKKVIVHHLGSNTAVATLINKLGNEIVLVGSCYSALCQDIDKYRANHWNRIMATMKRVYFRDFWRGAATIVGLVVLVFTLWNFVAPLVSTTLRLGDFFQFFF